MKRRLISLLLLTPLAALASPTNGSQAEGLLARLAPEDSSRLELASIDLAKLSAEDELLAGKPGIPLRYGVVQQVGQVKLDGGKGSGGGWSIAADGQQVWTLTVEAKSAASLEFGFSELRLPAGASLRLQSLDDKSSFIVLTDSDNPQAGRYQSAMLAGSRARLELVVPAAKRDFVRLTLDRVVHGYRDPFAAQQAQKSGSCNIDTICPQGDPWRDQIASVAHYTFSSGGSSFVCTGTLMATGNAQADQTQPRFTTAHHCVSLAAEAQSMVFYWGYESPSCRTPGSAASGTSLPRATSSRATQSGASLLGTDQATDFTVVQLSAAVPAAANAKFSGWDRSGLAPAGSVGIHHPAGHEKRITFNDDPLTLSQSCILQGARPEGTHWFISEYESGTTEGGSSGSGLWDSNSKLLVGVLSGGSASCAAPNEFDCYGRLSSAWEAGSSPSGRMRDWLDRTGSNPLTMPGSGSCAIPTFTLASPAFTAPPVAGSAVTFSVTTAGATGAVTYSWDLDGDGVFDRVGTQASVTASYPRATSAQVRVRGVDASGCSAIATRALDVVGASLVATAGAAQQVCGDNDAAIEPGERWKVPVTLRNAGAAALPAGARALFTPGAASSGVLPIGPNRFGYRATTTARGGCGFDFVDIASGANATPALATSVANNNTFGPLDDARTTQNIALGGSGFKLYGQTVSQAVMSTNGYVSFSTQETGGDFSNDCGGAYNNGAAGPQLRVHHDDLVVSTQAGAGLRYRYFASCPRQAESDRNQAQGCHVFQWSRMQIYNSAGAATGDFEFQAVAYERTGQVSYQYRSAAPDAGAGSSIGLSNAAGDDPLNTSCDAANAAPAQSAVCLFEPSAQPVVNAGLRIESATTAVPTLAAGAQTTIDVPIALKTDASCGAPLTLDYFGTAAPGSFSLGQNPVLSTSVGGGGTCQVSNACPAQVTAIPVRPGLYSNPARGGNGIAHFVYGSVYGGAWYTALPDRTPTWFTATGSYADNLATVPLERLTNTGSSTSLSLNRQVAGQGWVAQIDRDSVLYAWTLTGASSGLELMDAAPLPFANPNHSQTWFAPTQSGWGLAIEGVATGPGSALEFIGAYVYDSNGVARWLVGDSGSTSGGNVPLVAHRPHCPACPWFSDWTSQGQSAGSLNRSYSGSNTGTLDTAITLPSPLSGSWNRSALPITTIGAPAPPGQ